ncbi:outer membrane efflux protein [Legionella santicrucis]|uniref:Outer membrane efflux protein n=1 Tax=Legionella santicrucis TaxID=45074 RepID=A0A0W0ZFD5_9GAMM|nr:efflux transporter outer membrane subunit [Legionella santicrucis]KTD67630.1 outer membrane efflux protein [Legionella santicrucis]
MNLYPYYLFFGVGINLLTSCAVGPDFVKPTAVPSKTYTAKIKKQFGGRDLKLKYVPTNWWTSFHSSALNEMMQQGKKHNYSLTIMQENLAQAREMVKVAKGQLWPQGTLDAGIGRQKYGAASFGPIDTSIPAFTYYQIGPSANYILDVFGGTRRTIEKQQAIADYQQQELNATYLTVTGNIAEAFLEIAELNSQLTATQEIILDDKKNVRLVRKAFDLGATTQTQVLSAQSQLTKDETLLPPLYQRIKVAQSKLSILLGIPPAHFKIDTFRLKDITLPKELPLSLPSKLVHKRPDILAAESILHAASADIGIATAQLYPNITISATAMQEALIPFNGSSNAWSLIGNLTTPIFNGGALHAQRRASIHAYQSAYANYQQIVLNAFGEVHDVLYALLHDEEEVMLQKKAVNTAKNSLKLARVSFNEGNVGVLEILNAERDYAQARLGYVRAQAQRYQDTVKLYIALGG